MIEIGTDGLAVRVPPDWRAVLVRDGENGETSVRVRPVEGDAFALLLTFVTDPTVLAEYDRADDMESALVRSSEEYLNRTVEREIVCETFDARGWLGRATRLTDAKYASGTTVPSGEYRFLIRGILRLSEDVALRFALATNDIDSDETRDLLEYVKSFATFRIE